MPHGIQETTRGSTVGWPLRVCFPAALLLPILGLESCKKRVVVGPDNQPRTSECVGQGRTATTRIESSSGQQDATAPQPNEPGQVSPKQVLQGARDEDIREMKLSVLRAARRLLEGHQHREKLTLAEHFLKESNVIVQAANERTRAKFAAWVEEPWSVDEIDWKNASVGFVHCGEGGGYDIAVAVERGSGKTLAVVMPGE